MRAHTLHGVADLAFAAGLAALPRLAALPAGEGRRARRVAAATAAYSALTRYRLGVVRVLPMRWHLVLDGLVIGRLLAAAAAPTGSPRGRAGFAALAAAGAAVALATPTGPAAPPR